MSIVEVGIYPSPVQKTLSHMILNMRQIDFVPSTPHLEDVMMMMID